MDQSSTCWSAVSGTDPFFSQGPPPLALPEPSGWLERGGVGRVASSGQCPPPLNPAGGWSGRVGRVASSGQCSPPLNPAGGWSGRVGRVPHLGSVPLPGPAPSLLCVDLPLLQMLPSQPQLPQGRKARPSRGHRHALRLQDLPQGITAAPAPALGGHLHSRRPARSPHLWRLGPHPVRPGSRLKAKYPCFWDPCPHP